jgi:hypothetical protein
MQTVRKSRELSIKLGNAIGTGAELYGQLKAAKVNIIATCSYSIGGESFFSIVPDDPDSAEQVLRECEYTPILCDVLLVDMPNKPGALADLLRQVAEAGIQVSSAYVTTTGKNRAVAVLKTESNEKVLELLSRP